jgi:hypothetical protein
MSRSIKKPIVKDKPRNRKRTSTYWRTVRRSINSKLRTYINHIGSNIRDIEEPSLPQPQEVVNDYDYCDWVMRVRGPKEVEKYSRK